MNRRCSNGLVVVSVVHENGAEVPYDIDHEEDSTLPRLHGQVATPSIASNRMAFCGFDQSVIYRSWASESGSGCVGCEGEDQDDNE